jgi:hypothetical protein
MASWFDISVSRRGGSTNFRLRGDFDASSANRLLQVLQDNSQGSTIAVIETAELEHVYPSGRDVFQKNVHVLKDFCYRLVFSGTNAGQIAPDWIEYF